MAERLLREQSKALQQRLAKNDDKTRALGLRAWSGAVRTAVKFEGMFTPEEPAEYSVIVSVTVPAGRWIVLATTSAGPAATLTAPMRLIFSCFAYDAASNAVLPDSQFDNPSGFLYFPTDATPPSNGSVTLVNDLKADEAALVTFACVNTAGVAFTVEEPRLRLLPV